MIAIADAGVEMQAASEEHTTITDQVQVLPI